MITLSCSSLAGTSWGGGLAQGAEGAGVYGGRGAEDALLSANRRSINILWNEDGEARGGEGPAA